MPYISYNGTNNKIGSNALTAILDISNPYIVIPQVDYSPHHTYFTSSPYYCAVDNVTNGFVCNCAPT